MSSEGKETVYWEDASHVRTPKGRRNTLGELQLLANVLGVKVNVTLPDVEGFVEVRPHKPKVDKPAPVFRRKG